MSVYTEVHRLQTRRNKTAATAPLSATRQLLLDPTTSAVALMAACKDLLGEYQTWEPETIWVELARRGIDLPETNREKVMAGVSLLFVPSFYWDGVVFEKTAIAFDHCLINADRLEEATSAQLAWAVLEASWILSLHLDPARSFEHESTAYTAVVLHREGFVQTPKQLDFAQDALDRMNAKDTPLKQKVETAWSGVDHEHLDIHHFDETQVDVQLARLATVELHVQDRERHASAELALLG